MPPITPMVRSILIMNVVIFIMIAWLFPGAENQFALYDFESSKFRPYQLFTHMFMHGGWMHLFGNMFSLFIFGPMLEHRWGGNRFLTFYLITGLGASLLYQGVRNFEIQDMHKDVIEYVKNPSPLEYGNFIDEHMGRYYRKEYVASFKSNSVARYRNNENNPKIIEETKENVFGIYKNAIENNPMLGASGAVFGILMAFGMLFPNTELMLLFFPFPIKAKYFVLLYGAFELYSGLARNPGDNVAHFAHLGGMLFAYILLKFWERNRTTFY